MSFSLSSHLLPRSSPHLPFFPQWGRYITYFQPPCPATPHQFLHLIHTPACSAHTRRHTDLSAVKYFSSRSPSPDTEQTLKCVKNLLMVRPPHTFHLSNTPLLSTMVLFNITGGGCPLLPPNTHTEPHTHAHTHTRTHSYTDSLPPLPLFFHGDIPMMQQYPRAAPWHGGEVGGWDARGCPQGQPCHVWVGSGWVFKRCAVSLCVRIRVGVCSIDKRYLWHPKAKKRHSKKGPQHKGTESLIVLL